MPKRRLAVIVIAAAAALAAAPAHSGASGKGGLQNCGGSIRAGVVPCAKARRIAKEYAKTRAASLQGYSCTSKRSGAQINARCVLDEKLVVFSFRS